MYISICIDLVRLDIYDRSIGGLCVVDNNKRHRLLYIKYYIIAHYIVLLIIHDAVRNYIIIIFIIIMNTSFKTPCTDQMTLNYCH